MNTGRMLELMTVVERVTAEIPQIYRAHSTPLDAEKAVLKNLMHAADALAEARDLAIGDKATYVSLEVARRRVVLRIVDSAHTCMGLEQAMLMAEAQKATKH